LASNSRNALLDFIKLIGAILIAIGHAGFLYDKNIIAHQITCNGFFKTAVPFFFCLSGYYLYDYFKKGTFNLWVKRVFTLYVVWMLLYSFFWFDPNNILILRYLKIILTGFTILWYLMALLLGGIVLYYVREFKTNILVIATILLYLLACAIQYIGHVYMDTDLFPLNKIGHHGPLHRNFLFYAFPFLTIGYLIRRNLELEKISKSLALKLLIFSLVIFLVEILVNYNFIYMGGMQNVNLSYLILGPALLIFGLKYVHKFPFFQNNSKFISQYATIIYLLHGLVIGICVQFITLPPTKLSFLTTFF